MFTNQTISKLRSNEITSWLTATVLATAMLVVASCGGGGATLPAPQQNLDKPAAGTADLSGQLVQAGGERVVSEAGAGLPGVFVTLIDTLTGGKVGTDITDNLGKFEFKGVPSGDNYLVKLEFKTSQDLDGNGRLDEIELFFPVSLADQAVTQLLEEIGVTDSNGDGVLDALEVEIQLTDDNGRIEISSSQHRRRDGETRIDSNGNGSFDDDPSMSDSDSDGLADAPSPAAGSSGNGEAMELEVRGMIQELTETTITVGGVTFGLSTGTEWKINDLHVSPAEFSAGMFVKVEGFPNGSGGWTAHEVEVEGETSGNGNGDDNGSSATEREVRGTIEALSADSITVGGVTFALTPGTEWEINEMNASPADFGVGMFVKAEGFSDGNGGWIAHEVETEDPSFSGSGGDDDESGDDSDGEGDADESDDDNSGSDDDESGDDSSGSDDDEPGDDEDDEGNDDM